MPKKKARVPVCPYCGRKAVLVPDSEVYAQSYESHVWLCRPCKAWVGCHKNTVNHIPLGRLANKELRQLKIQVHELFDPLWRAAMVLRGWKKSKARNMAYGWLAKEMGVDYEVCHVGMFDEAQCRQAIEVCKSIRRKKEATA